MIKLKKFQFKNPINKVKLIKSNKSIFGTCLLLAVLTFIHKYLVAYYKRYTASCPACPAVTEFQQDKQEFQQDPSNPVI